MQTDEGLVPGVDGTERILPLLRPYARHCGSETRSEWRIGERCLLDYLLVFIASGHGKFMVDGEWTEAVTGDLFWIPPGTLHAMQGDGPAMDLAYVHFDLLYDPTRSHWDFTIPEGMIDPGELRPLLHPPLPHPRLTSLCGRLRGHTNGRVGSLLQDLCSEAARAQPFAGLHMSGLLLEIVAEVLRGQMAEDGGWTGHVPALERVAAELSQRCADPLSVAEVARAHGFSASYLRDLFSRHYGCSPRTYLRQARIRKARGLMAGTNMTLSEIAVQVGFETVHSFSRAFKATEHCTPTAYRLAGLPATRVQGRHTPYAH